MGNDENSLSRSWGRFAPLAQGLVSFLSLIRELCHSSIRFCSGIAFYLLRLLSKEMPYWDFPALAFLVEVSLKASTTWLSCLPALS